MKDSTVSLGQAVTGSEVVLPVRVQEALGELVGAAREGLLALSVGVGLGVLAELMEEEVEEVVGPKGQHDADRAAVRHGHESGEVTLGGRRVAVERPRVRTADGQGEVQLATYEHFADRDPLARVVMERMLASVSTRRYARTGEPVGSEVEAKARSTSKSAVSRTFVERTRQALGELMSRRLDDVRLAALMIDGIDLEERTHVVALGITTEGVKVPLGLWEGSTEDATVARALLCDLVDRGLDPEQGILFVIDGAQALRKAIRECLASGRRCSAANVTRRETSSITCTSRSSRSSAGGCGRPGRSMTTSGRSSGCGSSPVSSTAPARARRPRFARRRPRFARGSRRR